MTSTLLLAMTMLFLMGCTDRNPCPKVQYPKLEAIDKIPHYDLYVIHGSLDQNSTVKAFKLIKALRVSENYYYGIISDYRNEFVLNQY